MEEIETFDSNESKERNARVLLTELSRVCGVIFWLSWKRTKEEFSSEKETEKSDSKRPKG